VQHIVTNFTHLLFEQLRHAFHLCLVGRFVMLIVLLLIAIFPSMALALI
jgi:hypothetical protein